MCQTLRVLHHLRDYHIAMPLTYKQFKLLTTEVIIDRLIARDKFWLAYEICGYLKLTGTKSTCRVLEHWASKVPFHSRAAPLTTPSAPCVLCSAHALSPSPICSLLRSMAAMIESRGR
jgi:hypothetical protein